MIGRSLFLVLASLSAYAPLAIDLYLPCLPAIARDLNSTESAIQQTVTAFLFGFAVGMLFYGPLSDRYGRRRILLQGVAVFTGASVMCALVDSESHFLFWRLVQALGGGAATALSRAIVKDLVEGPQAARMLASMGLLTALAPLLAPLLGGLLLWLSGWRSVFWLLAVLGAASWVAVWKLIPETRRPGHAPDGLRAAFGAYGQLLRHPQARYLLGTGGFGFAAMFAYITATPFVFIEFFGVSPQLYGFFFGANILAIMLGSYTTRTTVIKRGSQALVALGGWIALGGGVWVAVASGTLWGGVWGVAGGLLLSVGAMGLVSSNCAALLMQHFERNAGAASALFGSVQFGLGTLASLAVSVWHDGSPWPMGLTIALCCLVCCWCASQVRGLPDSSSTAKAAS